MAFSFGDFFGGTSGPSVGDVSAGFGAGIGGTGGVSAADVATANLGTVDAGQGFVTPGESDTSLSGILSGKALSKKQEQDLLTSALSMGLPLPPQLINGILTSLLGEPTGPTPPNVDTQGAEGQFLTDANIDDRINLDPRTFDTSPSATPTLLEQLNTQNAPFRSQVDTLFGNDLFNPIDDDNIIERILNERLGGATQQVENQFGRGNLSTFGRQTALDDLQRQLTSGQERLTNIGSSLISKGNRDFRDIGSRAISNINTLGLGDTFDISPFEQERGELFESRLGSLEGDIRSQLGEERIFDPGSSLTLAGRTQGRVSGRVGDGSAALLDAISSRQSTADPRQRRGLRVRGSEAF